MGDINDGEADGHPNLRGGKAHAIGIDHGIEHVAYQVDQFLIHLGDLAATLAENGMAVLDNFENHGLARRL
jgi:hypothetical protein